MDLERYEAIGRNNARIIELLHQHCRNARVEKSPLMGQGMLEQMTGLPTDGREIRCQYALNPSMAGMNLEVTAIDFYRGNCIDCPDRDPRGIPNLKTYIDELERNEGAAAARRKRDRLRDLALQHERAAQRAQAVQKEPEATREWIQLLDEIDADEPDGQAAQEMLDIARAGPELCTPAAAAVLVETALVNPDRRLVEVVDQLHSAGKVAEGEALAVAVTQLSVSSSEAGVDLVVRLSSLVTPEAIRPTLRTAIALAAPPHDIPWGGGRTADVRLLQIASEKALPDLLDRIREMVGSASEYERGTGAGAAAQVIELIPGTADVLAPDLIKALELPGSLEIFAGSPRHQIEEALEAGLMVRPGEMTTRYLDLGKNLSSDARDVVVHAFDGVIRSRMQSDVPPEVGEHVVSALLELAAGLFGENSASSAAAALALTAKYHPELMRGRARALVGLLMTGVAKPAQVEPGTPPVLQALALAGQRALRAGKLSRLTETLSHVALVYPREVLDEAGTVLDSPDPGGEAARDLRAELTKLLGPLGRHASLRAEALHRMYSALVGSDQVIRAAAIEAWEELAKSPHFRAPEELEDLLVNLLADPYVIVHTRAVHALRFGLPVPDRLVDRILTILLHLARAHVSAPDRLDDTVDAAWRLSRRVAEPMRTQVRAYLLKLGEHLRAHDLSYLLMRADGPEVVLDVFADRLLQMLKDPDALSGDRDDRAMRALRDLPVAKVRARAPDVVAAARRRLPRWTGAAAAFLEILEAAGCWDAAAEVAAEMVAGVPDDVEHAEQRADVLASQARIETERALARHDLAGATTLLGAWREALSAKEEAAVKRRPPFGLDVLGGTDD